MKILVLNCGSSSLKYQLIDMDNNKVLAKGNYERIGEEEAFLTHKVQGEKEVKYKAVYSHEEALNEIMQMLVSPKFKVISSLKEIDGVGHRIVHGGNIFDKSVLVNDEVISNIQKCACFAPLHNPAAVQGILACKELLKDVPQVTTFDTAFHQTMPEKSYLYPIPYEYYEKYGVRKYGAHGTSHKYVSERVSDILKRDDLKIVTCHLGQGASIAAILGHTCIDTSMGLTPLGGIPMVTRSGDLDPSIVTYIMEKENLTPKQMEQVLNKKSGISAICGLEPDFRNIEIKSYENAKASLAVDVFCEKVAEYVARYAVKLGGLDTVVFAGGIGENQINVRKKICDKLKFMGLEIDDEKNNIKGEEREISTSNSKIKAYIIPTDEEMMIAIDTLKLLV